MIITLRMKGKSGFSGKDITLKDIADIISHHDTDKIKNLVVGEWGQTTGRYKLIEQYHVESVIKHKHNEVHIKWIGPPHTLLDYGSSQSSPSFLLFLFAWLLLFSGAALTIMYFHEDVSMAESQIALTEMLGGSNPLWFQIPYSFGLGIGMYLFFNRFLNKKFSDEPSPLEMEVHHYEKSLADFLTEQEKARNRNG
ncbi:stage V sporulation protein AA [Jeotgalibacillus aurantiacus]|uniref:stage V sporulation protein AA n=1 Tax=Jeotgalibacillus aurantiacus TaxID=2763266 RepID=UPI001D0AD8C5|nr:stage V sporulation protein AA [Jeotgalibacillus aurantiacus]